MIFRKLIRVPAVVPPPVVPTPEPRRSLDGWLETTRADTNNRLAKLLDEDEVRKRERPDGED